MDVRHSVKDGPSLSASLFAFFVDDWLYDHVFVYLLHRHILLSINLKVPFELNVAPIQSVNSLDDLLESLLAVVLEHVHGLKELPLLHLYKRIRLFLALYNILPVCWQLIFVKRPDLVLLDDVLQLLRVLSLVHQRQLILFVLGQLSLLLVILV